MGRFGGPCLGSVSLAQEAPSFYKWTPEARGGKVCLRSGSQDCPEPPSSGLTPSHTTSLCTDLKGLVPLTGPALTATVMWGRLAAPPELAVFPPCSSQAGNGWTPPHTWQVSLVTALSQSRGLPSASVVSLRCTAQAPLSPSYR